MSSALFGFIVGFVGIGRVLLWYRGTTIYISSCIVPHLLSPLIQLLRVLFLSLLQCLWGVRWFFTFKIIIFKGWLRGSRRSRRDMRSTACKPSIILWRRPPRKTLLTVAVKGMGQGCHCEWCVLLLFVGAQNGLIAQSIGQGKSEDKSEFIWQMILNTFYYLPQQIRAVCKLER